MCRSEGAGSHGSGCVLLRGMREVSSGGVGGLRGVTGAVEVGCLRGVMGAVQVG